VRDDDLAVGNLRRDDMEPLCDVLIRETVESVTAHPFVVERLRNSKPIGDV
jgi:hypothetical protein